MHWHWILLIVFILDTYQSWQYSDLEIWRTELIFELEIVLPTSVVTAVDLPFMLAWVYLESSQHRTILDLLLDYHQSRELWLVSRLSALDNWSWSLLWSRLGHQERGWCFGFCLTKRKQLRSFNTANSSRGKVYHVWIDNEDREGQQCPVQRSGREGSQRSVRREGAHAPPAPARHRHAPSSASRPGLPPGRTHRTGLGKFSRILNVGVLTEWFVGHQDSGVSI